METLEKSLRRLAGTQWLTIALLLASLVMNGILLTRLPASTSRSENYGPGQDSNNKSAQRINGPDYVTGIVDAEADSGRMAYVTQTANTAINGDRGVAYFASDIRNYLDSGTFDDIVKKHLEHMKDSSVTLPAHCAWALGYAWKYGRGANGRDGLGFYVVPMLMDSTSGKVYDYFDAANDKYYFHPKKGELNTIYDEGNLFP